MPVTSPRSRPRSRGATRLAAAIEIWNEPNNHHGSVQGPRPAEYAALLAQAYDAIKAQRARDARAGRRAGRRMAPARLNRPRRRDMRLGDYLQAMLAAGGAAHMDGLSFHPYPHSV